MSAQIKNAAHANDRVLIIERAFAAPRDLVFKMWTVREHVSRWLAPRGFTITQSDADVRPGGAWRSCMRSPEGVDHCVGGVYRDVVENERLVFTHAWDGDKGKPALAEPAIFTWTGYGLNVPGSGKCPTYKMTIDVTVVGTDVQGRFQQEGRPERNFKATLGADMKFKTTAIVGGGNKMDVVGSLKEGNSTIMLDGYCLFEGKLSKK